MTWAEPGVKLGANVNITAISKEGRILRSFWRWPALFCCLFFLAVEVLAEEPDRIRFMPVDQVKAGMVGVGKTVFSGTQIEEFQVEILGVLKKARPHGDIILAKVSGGPLAQTGVIKGMSGSPVYIEGKLIGAVAYAWSFSTQPICGIAPIMEMLDLWHQMEIGQRERGKSLEGLPEAGELGLGVEEVLLRGDFWQDSLQLAAARGPALVPLETPVMLSGFDERVVAQMAPVFQKFGLIPIQAGSATDEELEVPFEPGASLAVQLVRGDAIISAVGTLTHREGDRIIGFGHPMFLAGGVDFPMSGAYVHSVLPSQVSSFKLASATRQMGALRQDGRAGVAGIIGQEPRMLPIDLEIHYQDEAEPETFFFEIIDNKFFSPNLVVWTTLNALLVSGKSMGDATMELDARIAFRGHPDLRLRNIYTGAMPQAILSKELGEIIALLQQNKLEGASLQRLSLNISVENRRRRALISSARAGKQIVRPGEEVPVTVFLEPYRGEERTLSITIRVPDDAPEGRLVLQISDAAFSTKWEQNRAPHRFKFNNLSQLLDMLGELERNDQLIVKLVTARSGVVIKGQELPSLPPSALAVLRGSQRSGEGGMTHELVLAQKSLPTDYVLSGHIALPLTVRR